MPPRLTFARKVLCGLLLVGLADWLFFEHEPGWTLGLFALAWTAGLLVAVPAMRRRWPAAVLGIAGALGVVLIDDPNPLAFLLSLVAIASAALLPRHRFDDALRWGVIAAFGLLGLVRPLVDMHRLARRRVPGRIGTAIGALVLPVVGTLIFGALFAAANPLIGNALDRLEWPAFGEVIVHLIFWSAMFVFVWPSLRPRSARLDGLAPSALDTPQLPVATLTLSLVAFNLLFAGQNALDIAFLWSGAPLPEGMTLADYAHRGAYTLIATALLAGTFVLVALAPGSPAAGNGPIRKLVVLWVAQNVLLVASSILRLLDYIAAYSLTELRIAALLWMALVAVGLIMIAVRLLTGRSAAWLVNANAAAAAVVLLGSSAVSFGAVAAEWNVRHARSADQLDLCYLGWLGPSALLPLIDLERRAGGPRLRNAAAQLRAEALATTEAGQADWRQWTWRNARRLAAAQAELAAHPGAVPTGPRPCGSTGD